MIHILKEKGSLEKGAAIFTILEEVYDESPWTLQQVQDTIENRYNWLALAYDGPDLIGFLLVQENLFEAEVLQIAVRPAYQGRGIAGQLLKNLPQQKEIFLEVRPSNLAAQALYQKEQFKEIARRKDYYHHPNEDAIIMKKESYER